MKYNYLLDEDGQEFVGVFNGIDAAQSKITIWSDFIHFCAYTISSTSDKTQYKGREKQFRDLEKRYTPEQMNLFAEMFTHLIIVLKRNPDQDFLEKYLWQWN